MSKIAVIICTYNPNPGYFKEQIQSLSSQKNVDLFVYVYDDFSNSESYEMISRVLEKNLRFPYVLKRRMKNLGFSRNFIESINETPKYEYYSLCDQDDIWFERRLEIACSKLKKFDLYCSATSLFNGKKIIGTNKIRCKPNFSHSLIQSIAGGNTYVFNNKVKDLISITPNNIEIISHDWHIYQIVSGCYMKIFYDSNPSLMYRIHSNNIIGRQRNTINNLIKLNEFFKGKLKRYINTNLNVLSHYESYLSKDNQDLLNNFISARKSNLASQVKFFFKHNIKRDSMIENIVLLVGILFRRI